jgi:ketosteroid isomerase-like protein
MSEENVEFARTAIDAFNRGDLDWLVERADDDFIFDWTRSLGPLSGIYRGREGVAEFIREQWSAFEEFTMEPREFIDRGRHVVVPNTVHARGRGGIEVSASVTHVFTFEGDQMSRVTMYQQQDEALAATAE